MAKDTNKTQRLSDEEIFAEIKKLSEKAKENSSFQQDLFGFADIGPEDIDDSFDVKKLEGLADPDTSHRLYYSMRRLMMDNLPKGKANEKLRGYIYTEKKLFLNRGIDIKDNGRRGSDERMTYIENFLQQAFSIITEWIKSGANAFDLYMAFWRLNEERGYHKSNDKGTEEQQKSL